MKYVMLFKGNKYALHRGVVPGYPASHGCVRLPGSDAAYLYKNMPIGTTVIVR
jgi:lipoprotein-anchoring transpeptidase ErfK/SrfK